MVFCVLGVTNKRKKKVQRKKHLEEFLFFLLPRLRLLPRSSRSTTATPEHLLPLLHHVQVQLRQPGNVAGDREEARVIVVEGEVVLVRHRDRQGALLADGGQGEVDHRHLGRDCLV